MKKKVIIAVIATVCIIAILVVCAIMFKPEDNNKGDGPLDTSDSTSTSALPESESETYPPGYIEEETWEGPEIEFGE